MRHLDSKQREVVLESARVLDEILTVIRKRHGRLRGYDVLPRFVHLLLDRAETALVDVASGIVAWADGHVEDDGEVVTTKEHSLEQAPGEDTN